MKPGHRRILHQPLVPIQWTPPPPSPPSPPLFSSDPLSTTTSSTSSSPSEHDSSTTKIAIIVSSIFVGILFFLSILFLLFQNREARNPSSKRKRDASSSNLLAPARDENSQVGSTESLHHADMMVQLDLTHPSPEIKPLPPLLTREPLLLNLSQSSPEIKPLASLPRRPPDNTAASDEDMQGFTSKRSLEKSYSWSGTTRFSIGSSPDLSQQQTPVENVEGESGIIGRGIDNSDTSIVWGRFKSRSLRLDDDMIEIITSSVGKEERMATRGGVSVPKRDNRVLNKEKAESIEILLRALNLTTDDVCGALLDGSSEFLGTEFLESLVTLAPTKEEEFLMRHYRGDVTQLNGAERFLKVILDVPFAMKRIDVMLYRARFDTDIHHLKQSFQTLQDACQDLRSNKLFLRLLESAIGTANHLNNDNPNGNARFSRLDSLLTLCNARGDDGKATPLHFTVQNLVSNKKNSDIIREEEFKQKGLKAIAGLSAELENVKKAAEMDLHLIRDWVRKQELGLEKVRWLLQLDKACSVGENFFKRMKKFANEAETEIENVKDQEAATLRSIREITESFNLTKEATNPLRIFILVRDFLLLLVIVCKDLGRMQDRAMIGSLSGRFSHVSPLPSAGT